MTLWRQIAEAAWECADPGLQFDTTINRWHTAPNTGRITASNPCFTGESLVHTDKGLIRFDELFARANSAEEFRVWTHDITNADDPAPAMRLTTPDAFMITGKNPVQRLRFDNGMELRCTPGHRIFTTNRGFVEASELTADDRVRTLDLPSPAESADWAIPLPGDDQELRGKGEWDMPLVLPDVWTEDFAHYLGWLVGNGNTSGASASTSYGSRDDRSEILPWHQELIERINDGRPLKVIEQSDGAAQLRLSRPEFKRYLESLGIASVTGERKGMPWTIEQAPPEVAASFLRGLFDAGGCVVDNDKSAYAGLGSTSVELLRGVQRLLTTFGVLSHVSRVRSAGRSESGHTRNDGSVRSYKRTASFDLRIADKSLERFAANVDFTLSGKRRALRRIAPGRVEGLSDADTTVSLVERSDEGIELTYNLSEPRNHSYVVNGVVVRNCSEYLHLDNSACNLASINLLEYLQDDGTLDVGAFVHTADTVFTAQEILVGRADYPTEKIAETTRAFRQLGLGYANLGALLMALGLPYDSDAGRAWAASITSLMTASAYATSARVAARLGPFDGYRDNAEPMLRVLGMHRDASRRIAGADSVPGELVAAGQHAWDDALQGARSHGVRNSQATVIAPTGTIGLAMDCDTTGIEPDLALVKTKKLVGGGTMSIVNQTIPRALRRLGYPADQIDDIVAYIDEHMSVLGAPHLAAEHLPVFACSMGDNTIHYEGHVRMMAAVQPFVSGAISKTVNVPADVTVEDIEALHQLSWELGLKSVAIYRDNSKVGQPLSTSKAAADPKSSTRRRGASDRRAGRPRAGTPEAGAHAAGAHVRVPGGGLQGLRDDRRVRQRPAGRDLPHGVQAGLDDGGRHGRVRQVGQLRPPVRRAAAGLRRGVHQHALRAGRHDRRPGPAVRVVDHGLPLPPPGARVHDIRRASRTRHLLRERTPPADAAGGRRSDHRHQSGVRATGGSEVGAVGGGAVDADATRLRAGNARGQHRCQGNHPPERRSDVHAVRCRDDPLG